MKKREQGKAGPWGRFLKTLSPEAQDAARSLSGLHLKSEPQWHLLVIPDTDKPNLSEHHSFEAMRQAAKDAIAIRPCGAIFIFYGTLAPFAVDESNPQLHYVVHPNGQAYALFDTIPSLRIFDDGCFYDGDDEDGDDEETIEVEEDVVEYITESVPGQENNVQSPDPDDERSALDDVEPVEPSDEPGPEYP